MRLSNKQIFILMKLVIDRISFLEASPEDRTAQIKEHEELLHALIAKQ